MHPQPDQSLHSTYFPGHSLDSRLLHSFTPDSKLFVSQILTSNYYYTTHQIKCSRNVLRLGLKALASAAFTSNIWHWPWPRCSLSSSQEKMDKSICPLQDITQCSDCVSRCSISQQWILEPNIHIITFRHTQPWLSTAGSPSSAVSSVPVSSAPIRCQSSFDTFYSWLYPSPQPRPQEIGLIFVLRAEPWTWPQDFGII